MLSMQGRGGKKVSNLNDCKKCCWKFGRLKFEKISRLCLSIPVYSSISISESNLHPIRSYLLLFLLPILGVGERRREQRPNLFIWVNEDGSWENGGRRIFFLLHRCLHFPAYTYRDRQTEKRFFCSGFLSLSFSPLGVEEGETGEYIFREGRRERKREQEMPARKKENGYSQKDVLHVK